MAAAIVLGQDPAAPSDLDAIKDLLIKQKPLNRTYWQTGDEFSKLFAGGQIEFGMMWSGQAATMKNEGGAHRLCGPRGRRHRLGG